MKIIINGKEHSWYAKSIDKWAVGELAYKDDILSGRFGDMSRTREIIMSMSCTYHNAHPENHKGQDGIMNKDHLIQVQDGTVFNIIDTGNA